MTLSQHVTSVPTADLDDRWSVVQIPERAMERFREAGEVAALLRRLLSLRGSRLVQQEQLERALHGLEVEIQGGSTASRTRVTKLVAEISKALCEEYLKK
jgi:hypothetical protein